MASSRSSNEDTSQHGDIINLMLSLQYPDVTKEGVCRGIAMMGIQAFAIGQIDKFNERLQFIKSKDILEKINAFKAKAAHAHQTKITLIFNDEDKKNHRCAGFSRWG